MAPKKKATLEPSEEKKYERFPTADLLLDPDNPRLKEYGIDKNATQFDILKALWTKMAVEELAMSIAYNGYFEHEPLFLAEEGGDLVAIEGNRRLAAVKILLSADLRRKLKASDLPDIDKIDDSRRTELKTLPALVTTREEIWRYLGFKHVNGPATWGAYAKAQYIASVHNKYGVPLTEIAKQIGDYTNIVERQYHGLMVVQQAEDSGVFSRENANRSGGFEFSHIYTGLDHEGIKSYLGITKASRGKKKPVPTRKLKALGKLLTWIYGDKSKDIKPVMRTQAKDLKTLGSVLKNAKGRKALEDGLPLALAQDISVGDEAIFSRAIHEAKQQLQKAHGTLSTGFDPTDASLLQTARQLEDLSVDLVDQMEAKRRTRRNRNQN